MKQSEQHPLVFTIGHSTRSLEEFVALLKGCGVTTVIDVRKIPRSRRNPQFNEDALTEGLKAVGIGYVHLPDLGGHRRPVQGSVNTAWQNESFRGYADYMQTPQFADSLRTVIDLARRGPVALMCAEAVPWRCHRRLIADALLAHGIPVMDIISKTECRPHKLTPWARVEGTRVTYPAHSAEGKNE